MGKMIVYQIFPRLWGNRVPDPAPGAPLSRNGSGHFSDIDDATLSYLRDELGVSHLWFTGVIRHATTESFEGCKASDPAIVKGAAGSPYAIVDYFDVNPYLADNPEERMAEFESLINRTHSHGLKVVIDFVPNHVSRDYGRAGMVPGSGGSSPALLGEADDPNVHWRPENDFFYYPGQELVLPVEPAPDHLSDRYLEFPAKASGNCFSPFPGKNDWYETVRINYCDFHTPTWDKMLRIVRYWCKKGVDGFRCDMVEMVPWQFFKWLIACIKAEFPEVIFIAEVYQKEQYRHYIETVGFDFLYDKSGLYDSLRAIVECGGSARELTWNWQSLGDLQPRMLNFLENHDEQRFPSPFFGKDALKAGAPLCASLMFSEAPFMIYCGQEVGEPGMDQEGFSGLDGRTSIFDWWSVASLRRLNEYVHSGKGLLENEKSVLELYRKALSEVRGKPAAAGGRTFDLCYCNLSSEGFDPDRHFAFLRGGHGRTCLFVCNFSDHDASLEILVPGEALSYMGTEKTEAFKVNTSVRAFSYTVLPV